MKRDEKLRLLRVAYLEWIKEYPEEEMDQGDCHLPEIQAKLGLPKSITGFVDVHEWVDF